jgi:hypothetical protein
MFMFLLGHMPLVARLCEKLGYLIYLCNGLNLFSEMLMINTSL